MKSGGACCWGGEVSCGGSGGGRKAPAVVIMVARSVALGRRRAPSLLAKARAMAKVVRAAVRSLIRDPSVKGAVVPVLGGAVAVWESVWALGSFEPMGGGG